MLLCVRGSRYIINQSANGMKMFIALYECPDKVRKVAVYRFFISFLVPELLRFKDSKSYQKLGTKKMRGLRYNQSKLIKSVMSSDGHLIVNSP